MKPFSVFLQEEEKSKESHAVLAFARMQPPTSGHGQLIKKTQEVAKEHNTDHHIILSKTHDRKDNPLEPHEKHKIAKEYFPGANIELADEEHPTILHHAKKLNKDHNHLHVVAGEDRVTEFQQLLDKYNHRDYDYKSIHVHSAGKRTPSSEGVEGVSSSKLRDYANSGNFKDFAKSIPRHISDKAKKEVFNKVRRGMGLKEHKALFVVGPPCSGKDIIITEVKKYFDIVETTLTQLQSRKKLRLEDHDNILISMLAGDTEALEILEQYLVENGYDTKMVYAYISNEESQKRNEIRSQRTGETINEEDRYNKWLHCNNNLPILESIFDGKFIDFDNSPAIEDNMNILLEVLQNVNAFLNPRDTVNSAFESFFITESTQLLNEITDKKISKRQPFSKFVKQGPSFSNAYDSRLQGNSYPYSLAVASESIDNYGDMSTVTMSGRDEMETLQSHALDNLKPEPATKKKSLRNIRGKNA